MTVPIYQVDAFTDCPFAGNPAAVCLLAEPRDAAWMQRVAAEMNLSETAFLAQTSNGYHLRWFTPTIEVELCGHATLASAHGLWSEAHLLPEREARFQTRSGLLSARHQGEWIEMNFPSITTEPCEAPPELLEALGVPAVTCAQGGGNYLLEVEHERALLQIQPDFPALRELGLGVIVTSRSDRPTFSFVSRYFAPAYGVDEDPVTGSSHCALGPYWHKRLKKKRFTAFQASARGGVVRVRVEGDRTFLAGRAVTVIRGELTV